MTRLFWPIPQNWSVGDPWSGEHTTYGYAQKPAVECHAIRIGPGARLNRVHCPFCLSSLQSCLSCQAPGCSRQIEWIQCMRPAVFHCFGRDKSGAKTTLRTMALEGWETLLAVLLGVGHLRPLWQQTGWTPFGGMCWHGSASAATLSAPLQRHLMDLWKLSGQRREPSWQLSSQEPLIHFHKPPKKVSQINVEPLNSARDTQLPGKEATATASPGGPLGPFADCSHPMPIPSTPSMPLPTKSELTKQEEAQMPVAGPNAAEPPGRPLGLSAVMLLPNLVLIHRCRLQVSCLRPVRETTGSF